MKGPEFKLKSILVNQFSTSVFPTSSHPTWIKWMNVLAFLVFSCQCQCSRVFITWDCFSVGKFEIYPLKIFPNFTVKGLSTCVMLLESSKISKFFIGLFSSSSVSSVSIFFSSGPSDMFWTEKAFKILSKVSFAWKRMSPLQRGKRRNNWSYHWSRNSWSSLWLPCSGEQVSSTSTHHWHQGKNIPL